MSINPLDPKYQASPEFKPDKEPLWNHPMKDDGWTHAHNAIRQEMCELKGVLAKLGDTPLLAWEASSLKAWWKGHKVHIHDHHSNEDDLFMPFLTQRIKLPAKLTEDHKALLKQMEVLETIFASLAESSTVATLVPAWDKYVSIMAPHLIEEEQIALPLMRAYFTPPEIGKMVEKILGGAPAVALGSFFWHLPGGGGKGPAMKFMAQEGIPFFVWYLQFSGQHQTYKTQMVDHVTALMTGVPPKPASPLAKLAPLAAALGLLSSFAVGMYVSGGFQEAAEPAALKPLTCFLGLCLKPSGM